MDMFCWSGILNMYENKDVHLHSMLNAMFKIVEKYDK